MRRRCCIVALACIATFGVTAAQSRRPISETDLFRFTWIADPEISPDGASVAFVRVTVNERTDKYETSIFVVPSRNETNRLSSAASATPRRLTSNIRDTSPRWAPDGQRIAFLRSVEKDGKPQPSQLYLLDLRGGEARPLTNLSTGVESAEWSPDGRTIAFTSAGTDAAGDKAERRDEDKAESQNGRKAEGREGTEAASDGAAAEHKSDVKVITWAVYRANGNPDLLDPERRMHIWTISLSDTASTAAPKQITSGQFEERDIAWARDGSTIYFTSTRGAEPYYDPQDSDLYSVPATGGEITKIASIDGTISDISVSPDGRRLAFVGTLHGNPVRSYSQPDLWVTDVTAGSAPRNLTADYDFEIGGGIGGDQAAPRGDHPKPIIWSKDGASLTVVSAEHGSANLRRVVIATRKVEPITDAAQAVMSYTATPDGSTIAAVISTQTNIGDLFIIERDRDPSADSGSSRGSSRHEGVSQQQQVTHVNAELFDDIGQSEPEEMWYTTFDGRRIQSWILKPPDFEPSRKYPLILEIHGGPHSAYGNTYTHEFQWMAAKGYVVLFTNPRGSSSYGQEFGNIIQYHYPGDDYKDLMAGVDAILKRGYVDEKRLGVTGGSGGGLLTDWTITQTQRFAAAVAQRDIADWYGFWFTADFTLFQPTWFRKAPWEDPEDFHRRSPITHVGNVTTPLMLVLGDQDYRTPPADGGEMMFRALKYRKIPTAMVRFPRENHELSRSGEPWHRVERLRHIVGWMDQWLQGKKSPVYTTGQP